ncbi:MAG: PKD domain-containing protein [Flavobacteriales bacterium]|nr:PKD domain-containing protein [Flavobacteriales bacterium]
MNRTLRATSLIGAFVLAGTACATHIIGGEMYYDHLGGNQYKVTLALYRDCGPDNQNGTGFDALALFVVYDMNGTEITNVSVSDPGETIIPVDLDDPCLTAPPEVCVATTLYEHIFDLPPIPGGYTISYQRCCRTPAMVNLSGQQGITCTVHIPGPPDAVNSSPRFAEYPPIALCMDQDLSFDHSATDPDGDQLVYGLCAPFQGADALNPAPLAPPPPYQEVTWAAGYSAGMPLDSDPPIAIDPVNGLLTLHPTLQGAFTVGVCVTEIRNGVVIGESRRDFMFKVVQCNAAVTAVIADQSGGQICTGLTQAFENESLNGTEWLWDFGEPNTSADVSTEMEPTWTYTLPGTYTVTLIANPGAPCADTSFNTFELSLPLQAYFEPPPIRCPDELAEFLAEGIYTPTTSIAWDFGGVADPSTGDGVGPTARFLPVGVHPVTVTYTESGCTDSYTDSVVVYPLPVVDFTSDPNACVGSPFAFNNLSTAWTPMTYAWSLGDGTVSNDSGLVHIYENPGTYTVSLTAATSTGCIHEETVERIGVVQVYPSPVAAFTALPAEVSIFDPHVWIEDYSNLSVDWRYMIEGQEVWDARFEHWFDEGGQFVITQIVTSVDGCTDSTTRVVIVSDHVFYAPLAFTPDGDDLNEEWLPMVKGAHEYQLVIFDRWGEERFRTTDPKKGWNGDGLPQGLFLFTARVKEFGSYAKDYVGHFSLLR